MAARLNFNKKPNISWKGKTFSQITADVRSNTVNSTSAPILTNRLLLNPQPLKIYRKEIASVPLTSCNRRTSVSVFNFETPGNTIINTSIANTKTNGLIDMTLPNVKGEYPGSSCDDKLKPSNPNLTNRCISVQNNAKNRVRSSGIIRRKFDPTKNNDRYYTNTNQYLESRNRTFEQNNFHLLRQGNASNLPGSAAATSNVYASNTIAHCKGADINALTSAYVPVYYKPSNSRFAEQGAVSSSARLLRIKYDTITDAGAKLRGSFGNHTANALAYSTTDSSVYSLKQKVGYPNKKTPKFSRTTGAFIQCQDKSCIKTDHNGLP